MWNKHLPWYDWRASFTAQCVGRLLNHLLHRLSKDEDSKSACWNFVNNINFVNNNKNTKTKQQLQFFKSAKISKMQTKLICVKKYKQKHTHNNRNNTNTHTQKPTNKNNKQTRPQNKHKQRIACYCLLRCWVNQVMSVWFNVHIQIKRL